MENLRNSLLAPALLEPGINRKRRMKQRPVHPGQSLALDILDYLVRHPDAKDTVRGIAQWWLTEQRIRQTLADVRTALRELTEEGLVVECKKQDGSAYYYLNRKSQEQIQHALKSRARQRPVPDGSAKPGRTSNQQRKL